MGEELTQDKRIASLTTPLGKDKLVLTTFDGTEGLSELFEFCIDALSKDDNINFDKVLGRSCCVSMKLGEGTERYFAGIAVEAQAVGMQGDLYAYRLLLRPALWLLTRTNNCRIWHEKTALDIIKEVLNQRQVDFRTATTRNFPKLEYCVQYRETDFAFVSRLMEQHGIYYFFEHSANQHMLVLADALSSHQPLPGHATLRFATKSAGRLHFREQRLFGWTAERRFRTGKVQLRDYNFKQPNANMKGDANGTEKYAKAQMEFYDYPGKYDTQGDGRDYAEVRLGAEQALDHRRFAAGDAVSVFPGGLFTLEEHPVGAENQQYLIVRCVHRFSTELYRSGQGAAAIGDQPYSGNYEVVPSDKTFRAPIVTPKPLVNGPQTAKVVARSGKDGEEIDVDDDGHGRIKVRFHWDRDDKRSCWVRVAQMWASSKWGGHFIPRIGMEVVIEFLEGDPDRPLVVGAVYNGDNKFPYSLPDNKTQSGIKSNTSKGGNGYNELMFEDAKKSEVIRLHAQKDLNSTILHAETREIGENFESPSGSPSRKTTLKKGDEELEISSGNQKVHIAQKQTIDVDNDITITSMTTITLKVGANNVVIDQSGVHINGMTIDLKGSAMINETAPVIKLN
ncbi:MAG: type VI secretion system tip protein VgrG [Pseudomonadota bacterium]|nr:type VI secretion system tip protein VgrG [Pseudomonadota bacterium]